MTRSKIRTSGAEGLTLSSTDITIDSGDLLFGTSAKGVNLGVTSNTDSNTLDDYEEGTWTPVASSGSLTVLRCTYTKVGNVVHVSGQFSDITDTGTAANVEISGLPFASDSTQQTTGSVMFRYVNAPSDAIQLTTLVNPSVTKMIFYWSFDDGANWDNLEYSQASTTWDMLIDVSYKT